MRPKPVLISRPSAHHPTIQFGGPGYAYAVVATRFAHMFAERNIPVIDVESPEQAKSGLFATLAGLDGSEHLHLIFRGPEELRVMKGAYNVCWFSWEFDQLKADGPPQEAIVHDQVRMLRQCDEIWAPSRYTERVLRAHGIDNVHVVPAPIPTPRRAPPPGLGDLAARTSTPLVSVSAIEEPLFRGIVTRHAAALGDHPRIQAALAAGRLFLTVCHAMDPRKNLATLIDGFRMATAGVADAALIVKLVNSGHMEQPFDYLFHQIRPIFGAPHCLHEENVVLLADTLPEEEMTRLYSAADFYLCASLGEGQNLSLLEAMASGAVPVTVTNTAMADYVTADNAVRIAGRPFTGLVTGLANDITRARLTVTFSDRTQVAAGVGEALALGATERAAKARAAGEMVRAGYGEDAVMTTLRQRLKATRGEVVPMASRLRPSWWR